MSEVEMCMPFMRSKAEHMTDIIFFNSPNIILILDEELRIQQMNPSEAPPRLASSIKSRVR